jgi:hypothetical protein
MPLYDARLLDSPGLVEKVLSLLSAKQKLPEVGILAGQAVASAIDEVLGTGPAVYNDLDVFIDRRDIWHFQPEVDLAQSSLPDNLRLASTPTFRTSLQLESADYNLALNTVYQKWYQVVKTTRDGLLNLVFVSYSQEHQHPSPSRAEQLIAAFDLNNIQVAIDLKSRVLQYSPEFSTYFAGRELAIVNLYTPFQTLLRYFKKRDELKAFGNDALQVELVRRIVYANEGDPTYREDRINAFKKGLRWIPPVKTSEYYRRKFDWADSEHFKRTGSGLMDLPLAIGAKYETLLQRCWHHLEPFFEVHKHPHINVWLMASRPMAPRIPELSAPTGLSTTPSVMAARFKELRLPAPTLVRNRRNEFSKFLIWVGWKNPSVRYMYEHAYQHKGDAYLDGIESRRNWRDLQRVLSQHEELAMPLVLLNFREQIQLLRIARSALKELNLADAWGVFRGRDERWARRALADPVWLQKELKDMLSGEKQLVPDDRRLPLPARHGSVAVKELIHSWELLSEGGRMSHCVGGYSHAVEGGYSRIISLALGDEPSRRSTVEWQPDLKYSRAQNGKQTDTTVGELRLVQNQSVRNTSPLPELIEAEEALRVMMNAWLEENPEQGLRILAKADFDDSDRDDW